MTEELRVNVAEFGGVNDCPVEGAAFER